MRYQRKMQDFSSPQTYLDVNLIIDKLVAPTSVKFGMTHVYFHNLKNKINGMIQQTSLQSFRSKNSHYVFHS